MGLNSIITVVSLLLIGGLFWYRWSLNRKAAHMVGMAVPDTGSVDGSVSADRRVYYFLSDKCRVCREIAPMVDDVAAGHANLIRVDVGEHPEMAAQFRVMGTPTFVAVADGHIRDVKLGSPSKIWLQSYLEH